MLSKKIHLKNLSFTDKLKLNTLANEHRLLYNHLLSNAKQDCDFKKLNQTYKKFRNSNNLTIPSKSAQNTCRGVINNIKGFFAKRKRDKTAKFPKRFKSWKEFCSFTYDINGGSGGFELKNNQLILKNPIQQSKCLLKINLPEYVHDVNMKNVKTVTFKAETDLKAGEIKSYHLILTYKENNTSNNLNPENFISIDIGVKDLITSVSNTVDNFKIVNNKFKKFEKRVENRQSLRDKRNKGSRKFKKHNNEFKKQKTKLTNKRKDYQHKVTTKVIKDCVENDIGTLIVGDLNVKSCKKDFKCKLNKSTQNTGLSRVIDFLKYKAEKENIHFVKQNEAYTSRTNHLTGIDMGHLDLSVREIKINENLNIDRDINGAINIAAKYFKCFGKSIKKQFLRAEWLVQLKNLNKFNKMLLKVHDETWRSEKIYT